LTWTAWSGCAPGAAAAAHCPDRPLTLRRLLTDFVELQDAATLE
jgi:hypothetical protein